MPFKNHAPHAAAQRFWLGGERAAEQDRFFREALEAQGWEEGSEDAWEAGWVTGMPDAAQFRRASPGRRLNHFPGSTALTVKSRLHAGLAALRERIVESHGVESEAASRLTFFPRAWVMPDDYHALQEAARANPEQRWILKPTSASKGEGVRVLRDVGEAPLAPHWLVQEYVDNPHTIRGHKYVLRLYVLISALEPLRVYLYRQGFAKLASEPWDPDDIDNPYSQLTNPDVNARNERAEVPVEFIDLERYRAWLRQQGHDDTRLFERIHDLIALTAIAGVDAMRHCASDMGVDPRGCYELLGLDCLVDATLKPWLLECNLSPSLGTCAAPEHGGRIEAAIKSRLVHEMIALLDITGSAGQPTAGGESRPLSPVAEAEAERLRAGDFVRLLPSAEPDRYLPFFALPTLADRQLAEALAGRALPGPQLQRRGSVVELLEGEWLALYDARSGRYLSPNDTAAMIWLLATEGLDPDAIVDQLALAAALSGSAPDLEALRRDVWETLHAWCRDGLLCQRGAAGRALRYVTPDKPAPHTVPVPPSLLALQHDGRRWALEVGSAALLERTRALFGERLAPLSAAEAIDLPRLALLPEPAGYALLVDQRIVASRLTITQLLSALLAQLAERAAQPGRPVLDMGLLVTAAGDGVLCQLPDAAVELPHGLLPPGAALSRGVRLERSLDSSWDSSWDSSLDSAITHLAAPLGLPLQPPGGGAPHPPLPARIAIRALLVLDEDEAKAADESLDILGELLPYCVGTAGQPAAPDDIVALSDWAAGLEALNAEQLRARRIIAT